MNLFVADAHWGWWIILYFFPGGIAAGAYFTATLIDVYPPNPDYPLGFDLNICDSLTRMRYRHSLEQAALLQPRKVYPVTIQLYPTANIFAKGHRIRLDRLTHTQHRVLELFEITPPWPEQATEDLALSSRGKWG